MAKITYTNKVALNENPEIADINKVKDTDMNEIKTVVNGLDDNIGTLSNLTTTNKTSTVAAINELNSNKASTNEVLIQNTEPTAADNKIWIDTGEIASPVSEITNSYSTSTGIGYSANYVNNKVEPESWTLLANTVYYKKCGNIVTVRGYSTGTVSLTQNDYKTLGTLPSGYRPSMDLGFPFTRIGGTDPVGIVRIKTDGVIDIYSTTAGSYWAFTMTFVL